MVGITHDVVEDFDFQKLAGSGEVAGDFDVRLSVRALCGTGEGISGSARVYDRVLFGLTWRTIPRNISYDLDDD